MNYARKRILKTSSANRIPLARVYAILVTNALHMASIIYMLTLGPTQEGEAHSRALQRIIVNAVMMISQWFIYTPLTWFFGGRMESPQGTIRKVRASHAAEDIKTRELVFLSFVVMAAVNVALHWWTLWKYWGCSTPFQHIIDAFSHPFRVENIDDAPAYFLMWDLFGAIGASWLWILSDMGSIVDPVLFFLISLPFSPGAALMMYAAGREGYFIEQAWPLLAKRMQ